MMGGGRSERRDESETQERGSRADLQERGSGGGQRPADEPPPIKSYGTILEQEIAVAGEELQRPLLALIGSGLLAGVTVGTTVLVLAVAGGALPADASPALLRALTGNAYALGFILVIFARSDLFTEYTTIAVLPVLVGRASVGSLARLWGVIYASNLVGAIAMAAFLVFLLPGMGSAAPESFGMLAAELTRHSGSIMVASAILAGWLMGLLSWLVVAARETISQLLFVWIVGFTIGFAQLHHCITGAVEVFAAVFARAGMDAVGAFTFLGWATLGNVIGSLLFALMVRIGVVHTRRSS